MSKPNPTKTKEQRAAEELLAMMEDDEEHEAAVAAVEAMPAEQLRAEYEAYQEKKKAKTAKVVSLETRRKRPGITTAWLVAASLAAIAASTVGVLYATRDDGIFGRGNNVAHPFCAAIVPGGMSLDGVLARRGDAFVLDLATPLCGEGAGDVKQVDLTPAAGVDLAPLVGKDVTVEGVPHASATRTTVDVRSATPKPRP